MANQGSNTGSLHFKVLALKNYSKLYIQTTEEFWVGKWYSHICFDGHSDDYVEGKKRGGERKWKASGQVKFFFFVKRNPLEVQERGKEVDGDRVCREGEELGMREVQLPVHTEWMGHRRQGRVALGSLLGFCLGQLGQMVCFYSR